MTVFASYASSPTSYCSFRHRFSSAVLELFSFGSSSAPASSSVLPVLFLQLPPPSGEATQIREGGGRGKTLRLLFPPISPSDDGEGKRKDVLKKTARPTSTFPLLRLKATAPLLNLDKKFFFPSFYWGGGRQVLLLAKLLSA